MATFEFPEAVRRTILGLTKILVVMVSGVLICAAQQDRGTILGTVIDTSGAVIPQATVVVENQGTGRKVTLTTDSSGVFIAPELPVGTYRVTVSFRGFTTKVHEDVNVRVSDRVKLSMTLEPGQTKQTVTVTGQTPLLETASDTLGGTLTKTQVENLPLNGRDPNYLLALIPGVNLLGNMFQQSMNGMNTGGQSVGIVTFLMDGVDASRVDAQTIPITYGRSQNRIARVNEEGIQEVREFENSFSAEYGGSTGAVVNIITRSGTNQYHGSLFEFVRNEKFDARNYFNPAPNQKPAFRLNQFGGSLGGPIKKDRAFFFGSYEAIRQRTGTSLIGLVPTQEFRNTLPSDMQQVAALMPLPNAGPTADPRVGFYNLGASGVLNENSWFGRVDYDVSTKDRLSVRYNVNKSQTLSYFGVGTGQIAPNPGLLQSGKLTYTRSISPTLLNEASFAFNRMHIDPRSSTDPAVVVFPYTAVGGLSTIGPALFDLSMVGNSFTWLDTLSWVKGSHQIKIGTAITRNQQNKALFFQKIVSYPTIDDFAIDSPFSVSTLGYPRTGLRNTYYNFFVQDDIQVTRKLTFNAGLRYQYETSPADANDRQSNYNPATMTLEPQGTQLMEMPKTNFGPRLSFAYTPFDSNNTVLRGAYGIYFVNFNATLVQNTPSNGIPTSASLTRLQDPTLQGFPFPDINTTPAPGTLGLNAVQHDWHTPYVQNWNFNIQQRLGGSFVLQVGYVANKGTHIITPAENLNRFLPGSNIRPDPNWGNISYLRPNGVSSYNALQVVLSKRISRGLQFHVNYTWGHALDDSPPVFSANSDDHNVRLDYGTTESDVKHLVSFDYIYQPPTIPKLPRWLGGGWQINGLTQMRGGLPINIMCGCDPLQVGQFTSRADIIPGAPVRPTPFDIPTSQFNIAAFTAPPTGRIGNVPRGAFRGPAIYNFDFSLFKNFKIHERHEFQFRAEFFNIFNTPQFNLPGSSIVSAGNFGVTTGTLTTVSGFGSNRQIQFGLRYNF